MVALLIVEDTLYNKINFVHGLIKRQIIECSCVWYPFIYIHKKLAIVNDSHISPIN